MPKFNVMADRSIITPYFKTFEAPTMEDAERLAELELENLRLRQDLPDLGWEAGDANTEYCVQHDSTTEVK